MAWPLVAIALARARVPSLRPRAVLVPSLLATATLRRVPARDRTAGAGPDVGLRGERLAAAPASRASRPTWSGRSISVRPVPDVIAAPESGAWPLALAVLVVIALAARFASGRSRSLALRVVSGGSRSCCPCCRSLRTALPSTTSTSDGGREPAVAGARRRAGRTIARAGATCGRRGRVAGLRDRVRSPDGARERVTRDGAPGRPHDA